MSRIGKKPVALAGTTVKINGREISVNGKGGTLTYEHRPEVSVRIDDDAKEILVERHGDGRVAKAMHGLTRSLIANMIDGVTKGYEVNLEIHGVGYGGQVQGNKVKLKLGFADERVVTVPTGVTVEAKSSSNLTELSIKGIDKQLVGQTASAIRQHRKPEPYNGKGVRYKGEQIIRKQGKAFGS
ncbi:MAG: 50S ribosomal protein L6 [Planctomycetota bacterium]